MLVSVRMCVSIFQLCSRARVRYNDQTTKLSRYCCLYLDMEEREGKELEEDTLPACKRVRVCVIEQVIVREKAGRQLCVQT